MTDSANVTLAAIATAVLARLATADFVRAVLSFSLLQTLSLFTSTLLVFNSYCYTCYSR